MSEEMKKNTASAGAGKLNSANSALDNAEENARIKREEEQKRKAEARACEETKVEDIPQTPSNNAPVESVEDVNKQWISFKALLSTDDAIALKQFFNDRNIVFEKI